MKPEKIKPYMALLNVSNSQETLGYVERQIKNMDISMKEFYGSMEMASDTLELYRDEGGFHTFVQLHTHMFYEVIFCQSTCGAEYLVGSDRYKLQRGDLLFISPRVEHTPPGAFRQLCSIQRLCSSDQSRLFQSIMQAVS